MVPNVDTSRASEPSKQQDGRADPERGNTPIAGDALVRWTPVWLIAVVLSVSAWGCGGGKPPAEKESSDKPTETAGATKSEAAPAAKSDDTAASSGESDSEPAAAQGAKAKTKGPSIDGIPLDVVWYDDPLAVASDATPVGGGSAPAVAAAPTKPAPSQPAATPAEAAPAASGGSDWKDLITGELIGEETKKIKNRLTDSLSSVGKYNGNYKDGIQVDGVVLAALAQVLHEHPDSLSWKGDAPTVRDLSAELAKKAKGLGQASYDPSKEVFIKLEGVLSGNKPPGLEEAPPKLPFGEFANRMGLMKRMQKSFDYMKSNIQNEAAFKKEAETIQHEAAMLATLTKVTGAKEYPGGDEDEYQQFIKDLVQASKDVVEASKADEYPKFQDGMTRVQKLCDACHQAYRFGDG